ncbi:coniferyl aldehyde dehydrogenase [Novosphingobium cyanobacteriorum]|uniref:Aldehyde dehydrogenase n=1 Tax=Novosphingobium cyanobacteriorum TaxID=3024215 RepID=A0ABT6CE51_9SPHN|nr:coniferyl aldehyde dehydrogenase [Novosphingobium cyanobacteriorum]MDF8332204.1 coniferyl aldehyde dehydrogenase [Novosphingobium cyanobacteriorum]
MDQLPADQATAQSLKSLLALQRVAQLRDGTPSAALREDRLDRCIALLQENRDRIETTISADFGNRSVHATGITDVMSPIGALRDARKHLRKWMRTERRTVEPRLLGLFGARCEIRQQPKGIIGIIAPWNFPVGLVFSPLAGVLAAGNRAIIKPSEFTPRTSDLLQELIASRFSPDEIAVVSGGAEVGAAFAALPFDHLVFTGAGSIAKHVMRAAADNLVPLTLELGGKSPVVIGKGVNLETAAARVMAGKTLNAGQICLAPDHVFVPAGQIDQFVSVVTAATTAMFPSLKDNPDYTAIISDRHFDRIRGYVEDARAKGAIIVEINPAHEDFAQQPHRRIPPTLILGATPDMAVMQDEIFGPLLPVIGYDNLDAVIAQINGGDRPLALYYFGADRDERERLLKETTSGGVTVNDVIMHCAQENLPFGGIGPSGMGVYHGVDGFREFSHRKSVYTQLGNDLGPMKTFRPPYGEKIRRFVSKAIG